MQGRESGRGGVLGEAVVLALSSNNGAAVRRGQLLFVYGKLLANGIVVEVPPLLACPQ